MLDEKYMKIALDLAKQGIGRVNPNPLVGAVIVKDNNIIATGYHKKYGGFHAEIDALNNCNVSPKGTTMYVTLEPCCHHGKTPPCSDAIIQSGIKRVVIGCLDPNPIVSGNGLSTLQKAGIKVEISTLEEECVDLNHIFFHYIKSKRPYVLMKYAMTLDGKIATSTNLSKWISNKKSRSYVHTMRNKYRAIMVGVGTILSDNPHLDCRLDDSRNPIRIICDSNLKTPLDSNVVVTANEIQTIIATVNLDKNLHKLYLDKGVQIITTSCDNSRVNLKELMKILGQMNIDSILLEGGSTLNFSAIDDEIIHRIHCYISPKIFGGYNSKSPIGGKGFENVINKINLTNKQIHKFDDDIMIESEVSYVHRDN